MPRRTRTDIPSTGPEAELTAINAEIAGVAAPDETQPEPAPDLVLPTASPKPPSGKLGQIQGLIAAFGGATIDDLIASTGWQPHTIRAAFSRLRRRGFPIILATDTDGRKAYRLEGREG